MTFYSILLCIVLYMCICKAFGKWGYSGYLGPDMWPKHYPICGGKQQSPIRILTSRVVHNPFIKNMNFRHYDSTGGFLLSMYNNGKSVQVRLSVGAYIDGGGLLGRYKTAQFHFHWSNTTEEGSEHVLEDKSYPLELHIVHYAEKYKSLEKAMVKPDGLAVVGIFFQIQERDNPNITPIVDRLGHISMQGQSAMIKELSLHKLLPKDPYKFYRYQGSLTTPPCLESVTWTVFHNPIGISHRQLKEFHRLKKRPSLKLLNQSKRKQVPDPSHPGYPIVLNYRPPQKLNGRIVYASFMPDEQNTAATLSTLIYTKLVISFAFYLICKTTALFSYVE